MHRTASRRGLRSFLSSQHGIMESVNFFQPQHVKICMASKGSLPPSLVYRVFIGTPSHITCVADLQSLALLGHQADISSLQGLLEVKLIPSGPNPHNKSHFQTGTAWVKAFRQRYFYQQDIPGAQKSPPGSLGANADHSLGKINSSLHTRQIKSLSQEFSFWRQKKSNCLRISRNRA